MIKLRWLAKLDKEKKKKSDDFSCARSRQNTRCVCKSTPWWKFHDWNMPDHISDMFKHVKWTCFNLCRPRSSRINRFKTCSNIFKPCLYKQLDDHKIMFWTCYNIMNTIKHVRNMTKQVERSWKVMFSHQKPNRLWTCSNIFKQMFYK